MGVRLAVGVRVNVGEVSGGVLVWVGVRDAVAVRVLVGVLVDVGLSVIDAVMVGVKAVPSGPNKMSGRYDGGL